MQTVGHFFTQEAVMSDSIHSPSTHDINDYSQQEDAALKTAWQFFASDLLPFFQISGSVKGHRANGAYQSGTEKAVSGF